MKITFESTLPSTLTFRELKLQEYFVFADSYRRVGEATVYRKHVCSEAVDLASPFTCLVASAVPVFRVEITHVVAQVIGGLQ